MSIELYEQLSQPRLQALTTESHNHLSEDDTFLTSVRSDAVERLVRAVGSAG